MNNKIRKTICYLIIFFIITICLTGCSKTDDSEVLKEKVNEEISFLDTKLIDMLNKTNGISLENYIVVTEQVNQQSTSTEAKTTEKNKTEGGADSSSEGESNRSF